MATKKFIILLIVIFFTSCSVESTREIQGSSKDNNKVKVIISGKTTTGVSSSN